MDKKCNLPIAAAIRTQKMEKFASFSANFTDNLLFFFSAARKQMFCKLIAFFLQPSSELTFGCFF